MQRGLSSGNLPLDFFGESSLGVLGVFIFLFMVVYLYVCVVWVIILFLDHRGILLSTPHPASASANFNDILFMYKMDL